MIKVGGRYRWTNPDYGIELIVTVLALPRKNTEFSRLYDCRIEDIVGGVPKNDHLFKIGHALKLGGYQAHFVELMDPVDILKEML